MRLDLPANPGKYVQARGALDSNGQLVVEVGNPTRVPIGEKESVRWLDNLTRSTARLGEASRCVHIGDREADIFELFAAAHDASLAISLERLASVPHGLPPSNSEAACLRIRSAPASCV